MEKIVKVWMMMMKEGNMKKMFNLLCQGQLCHTTKMFKIAMSNNQNVQKENVQQDLISKKIMFDICYSTFVSTLVWSLFSLL